MKEYASINIKVNREIKEKLDNMKIHPREPYHEVLTRLIKIYEYLHQIKKDSIKQPDINLEKSIDLFRELYNYI